MTIHLMARVLGYVTDVTAVVGATLEAKEIYDSKEKDKLKLATAICVAVLQTASTVVKPISMPHKVALEVKVSLVSLIAATQTVRKAAKTNHIVLRVLTETPHLVSNILNIVMERDLAENLFDLEDTLEVLEELSPKLTTSNPKSSEFYETKTTNHIDTSKQFVHYLFCLNKHVKENRELPDKIDERVRDQMRLGSEYVCPITKKKVLHAVYPNSDLKETDDVVYYEREALLDWMRKTPDMAPEKWPKDLMPIKESYFCSSQHVHVAIKNALRDAIDALITDYISKNLIVD